MAFKFSLTTLFLLLFFSSNAYAVGKFYQKKAEGWFWYEDRNNNASNQNITKNKLNNDDKTATSMLEDYQVALKEALSLAVLEPSVENVVHYMKMQRFGLDKSMQFAEMWQRALLFNPQLDPSLKYPVNNTARQIYLSEERINKIQYITELSKTHGLFFFFKSQCKYCHIFAKTVKAFAASFNWTVVPISLDGIAIPEFPNSVMDNGIAANLDIYATPALFAINPKENSVFPITYGLISEQEIIDRLYTLGRVQR